MGSERSEEQKALQEKTTRLFTFIKELAELKNNVITDVNKHPWHCFLSDIPADPENIAYGTDEPETADTDEFSGFQLRVTKPELEPCPEIPEVLRDWVQGDWEDYHQPLIFVEQKALPITETGPEEETEPAVENETAADEESIETFSDDPQRTAAREFWATARDTWAERQKLLEKTQTFFNSLYLQYKDIKREPDKWELVIANGLLKKRDDAALNHPLVMKKLEITFEPEKNCFTLRDSDRPTELYVELLHSIPDIDKEPLAAAQKNLADGDVHPLDKKSISAYLQTLIQSLSPSTVFYGDEVDPRWKQHSLFCLCLHPVLLLRRKQDGSIKTIERISEKVKEGCEIPEYLKEILRGGERAIPAEEQPLTITESLAEMGGESRDILLSKPANREQLEIAKRIEKYNAVVVQGPPGTGKTHTIANLMGHFFAQGKSVLVTSYTTKALTVLKEKLPPQLRDLCVSVLEDSTADMESSINGITAYMAQHTGFELKKAMEECGQRRADIIARLTEAREKLLELLQRESSKVVICGEAHSLTEMAKFVFEHQEDLSFIPGKIHAEFPLPLSTEEWVELYRSNNLLSKEETQAIESGLPEAAALMSPDAFGNCLRKLRETEAAIQPLAQALNCSVDFEPVSRQVRVKSEKWDFAFSSDKAALLNHFFEFCPEETALQDWMVYAAVDGKRGAQYTGKWQELREKIQQVRECRDASDRLLFGKTVSIPEEKDPAVIQNVLSDAESWMKDSHGVLSFLFRKEQQKKRDHALQVLDGITINGKSVSGEEEFLTLQYFLDLQTKREECAVLWDRLIGCRGGDLFSHLDEEEPERIAEHWLPTMDFYLQWYPQKFPKLCSLLEQAGLPNGLIFPADGKISDNAAAKAAFHALTHEFPPLLALLREAKSNLDSRVALKECRNRISRSGASASEICQGLLSAIDAENEETYRGAYRDLVCLKEKSDQLNRRTELLSELAADAPDWAAAIREKTGIHGRSSVPEHLTEAWQWKQYSAYLDSFAFHSLAEAQAQCEQLSREYREITAEYAEKSAWYHLLRRTEGNVTLKQALEGWKLDVKKIGAGTGKRAAAYRKSAREKMAVCQRAVPGWIMPLNKAMDTLDPKVNQFDIIIVDEASQADVTALVVAFMAKKLIIVGDDKQISPMGIGDDTAKLDAICETYLKGQIPNAELYSRNTSLYDIASTTFQTLMLKEHFRCVPQIINYCNNLSYDWKIKPLREAGSSSLLPAVVNYQVADGKKLENKTNLREAETITALLKACLKQPEYAEKTFGVISLLGDGQAALLGHLLSKWVDAADLEKHQVLWGASRHFQGDERDVIFLSLVDSSSENGPQRLKTGGANDSTRQRYNVAVSRARDQLWVVHSLNYADDLKEGDIRRDLITYAMDPESITMKMKEVEEKSESPFESSVAGMLIQRGYHVEQQVHIGAYRLDMTVSYRGKRVAVECDGERYHSGLEKIREDMERQTVLERMGWHFIRIRGSEFYRSPEKTILRVVGLLASQQIFHETDRDEKKFSSDLQERVKTEAMKILEEISEKQQPIDTDTLLAALTEQPE